MECEWNQEYNNYRIENNCREDSIVETHNIEGTECRVCCNECCRYNGEILGNIVCDGECGQRTPGHEELLPDLNNLYQFRRVAVEVDHVCSLPCRLCPCIHCDSNVRLGQCRCIVRTISCHRYHTTARLVFPDHLQFAFGCCFSEEIINSRFCSDRSR